MVVGLMFKNTGVILLCLALIFATSGNSRGLIFKNLAKTSHSIHTDANTPVPANEEIIEQVHEKKLEVFVFLIPAMGISKKLTTHGEDARDSAKSSHIQEIPVPPPEKLV